MQGFSYPVTLIADRKTGGYVVTFKNIPEAITQGENLRDALWQAANCLEEAIAGRIRCGENIPKPSIAKRRRLLVPVPASTAAKAALYLAMREAGVTGSELARRLRRTPKSIERLLDPKYPSNLPRLQEALAELNKRLVVDTQDVA